MAPMVLVFKILFLVLIIHSSLASFEPTTEASAESGSGISTASEPLLESALIVDSAEEPSTATTTTTTTTTSSSDDYNREESSRDHLDRRAGDRLETSKKRAESVSAPLNPTELCYLSNGGSSLTLTVNEATQVGSIIGTVEVNGDPSLETGNVDLFDAPEPAAVPAPNSSLADNPAPKQPLASKSSRRILGRRAAPPFGVDLNSSSNLYLITSSQADNDNENNASRREPKMLASPAPPPVTTTNQLLGLVSEHQADPSSSFYSLLAGLQQQQQQAVRLEPGTWNLVLQRPLDKESAEGEQGIVINIRCRPRQHSAKFVSGGGKFRGAASSDATTIPVRIIITDANDHAPVFLGAQPYVVNISETTPIGSIVSRDILAQDRDSAGPFSTLHYRVLEDRNNPALTGLLQFPNPLEPTLAVAGPLDYETLGASFMLLIVAEDQGEPEPLAATAQVQVNVIDFDDQNPKFLDDKYTLIMDETQQNLVGQNLQILPRNLYAEDGDKGIGAPILYSFDLLGPLFKQGSSSTPSSEAQESALGNSVGEESGFNIERYLHLNPTSGEIRLLRQWPAKWAGSPMTLVVRATQADNKDRYTLTTLTIARASAAIQPHLHQSREEIAPRSELTPVTRSSGIEFNPDRLLVNVLETAAINEKIARVRARYLGSDGVTSTESSADGGQAVDLIVGGGANQQPNNRSRRTRVAELQQATKRPIIYQILDDQTDQFGINGLGEIFIKRQLDYEQRQEYKFRVLASYTKFSDICQVQVNVLNVNDNKPKFTQPQYTFHLTETRLKSKLIGTVQAHDLDLNDSIKYSLQGEHAHLFEINPSGGQISLRAGIKQLNMSNCQLLVQASDSLGSPFHSHQARVHLHIAPQLVGRSINFEQILATHHSLDNEAKLFNSRSLIGNPSESSSPSSRITSLQREPPPAAQRSSVATVMSSLQHMLHQVNFFDMPMSSALLLSALLALLVCLLVILVVSMSVHIYRRQAKLRHRRHLATLRHAHLAALHPSERARYLQNSALSSMMSVSSHSSPSASAINNGSPAGSLEQPASSANNITNLVLAGKKPERLVAGHKGRTGSRQSQVSHSSALSRLENSPVNKSAADNSLVSSASKRSYHSNTTDDSSVIHCGHYNVNLSRSPQQKLASASQDFAARSTTDATQSSIEAALKSLVREAADASLDCNKSDLSADQSRLQQNELSVLTNSKPGMKSYRKLPVMGSLVRPIKQQTNRVRPLEHQIAEGGRTRSQDSAIASDSSSNESAGALRRALDSQQVMRNDIHKLPNNDANYAPNEEFSSCALSTIRWPRGLIPSRVKKLTWDDELSLTSASAKIDQLNDDDDCYVSSDIRFSPTATSQLSPLTNHQYLPQETTTVTSDGSQYILQQRFLFSNPCSPTLPSIQSPSNSPYATSYGRSLLKHQPVEQNQETSNVMGENNCFDYTIVQSSQFQVHEVPAKTNEHLLQEQARQQLMNTYMYNNDDQAISENFDRQQMLKTNQRDLKLLTTAVL